MQLPQRRSVLAGATIGSKSRSRVVSQCQAGFSVGPRHGHEHRREDWRLVHAAMQQEAHALHTILLKARMNLQQSGPCSNTSTSGTSTSTSSPPFHHAWTPGPMSPLPPPAPEGTEGILDHALRATPAAVPMPPALPMQGPAPAPTSSEQASPTSAFYTSEADDSRQGAAASATPSDVLQPAEPATGPTAASPSTSSHPPPNHSLPDHHQEPPGNRHSSHSNNGHSSHDGHRSRSSSRAAQAEPAPKIISWLAAAAGAAILCCLALAKPFLPFLPALPFSSLVGCATLLTSAIVAGGTVAAAAGGAVAIAAASAALLVLMTEVVVRAAAGSRGRMGVPIAPSPRDVAKAFVSLVKGRPMGNGNRGSTDSDDADAEEDSSSSRAAAARAPGGLLGLRRRRAGRRGAERTAAGDAVAAEFSGLPEPLPWHVEEELARVRRAAAERESQRLRAVGRPCPPEHAVAAAGALPASPLCSPAQGGGHGGRGVLAAGPTPVPVRPGAVATPGAERGPGDSGAAGGAWQSNVVPATRLPSLIKVRKQA